jgi:hypothetical protein
MVAVGMFDELARSLSFPRRDCVIMLEIIIKLVIPAQAGIQNLLKILDSRFHGNDKSTRILTFYESVMFGCFVIMTTMN